MISVAVVFLSLLYFTHSLAPFPSVLPNTFGIGCSNVGDRNSNGNISIPQGIKYYYQYLAGDVTNNKTNWFSWQDTSLPAGQFVLDFIQTSGSVGAIPTFSYYMIVQSAPVGNDDSAAASIQKLQSASFVNAYFANIAVFMMKAGANTSIPVIFHFEPDFLGYMENYSHDNISVVHVSVSNSGYEGMSGFSDDLRGLIAGINYLRNKYAPNVLLAYQCSVWGTNTDIQKQKPDNATVVSLAGQSAAWLAALDPNRYFSLVFFETTDRDAAFYCPKDQDGNWCTASSRSTSTSNCCPQFWWNDSDWARNILYIQNVLSIANRRGVFWQMPFGNQVMMSMNNVQHHYQDNKVQWLLGANDNNNMNLYNQIGIIAFLWGGGSDATTTITDAANDGITNPAAINGNNQMSTTSADDGGYFAIRTAAYQNRGFLTLAGSSGSVTSGGSNGGTTTTTTSTTTSTSATGGSGRLIPVTTFGLLQLGVALGVQVGTGENLNNLGSPPAFVKAFEYFERMVASAAVIAIFALVVAVFTYSRINKKRASSTKH